MRPATPPSFRIRRARDEAIRNRRWAMRRNSTELWRRAMDSTRGHFVTNVEPGTPADLSGRPERFSVHKQRSSAALTGSPGGRVHAG